MALDSLRSFPRLFCILFQVIGPILEPCLQSVAVHELDNVRHGTAHAFPGPKLASLAPVDGFDLRRSVRPEHHSRYPFRLPPYPVQSSSGSSRWTRGKVLAVVRDDNLLRYER